MSGFSGHYGGSLKRIRFADYSVHEEDPIHSASHVRDLEDAIFRKIARSHVIVIPNGVYATYSKWIKRKIRGSRAMNKSILAVNPRDQQRRSSIVADAAAETAEWTRYGVVAGIGRPYRQS